MATRKRTRPDSTTAEHRQPEQKQQRPSEIANLPLEIWDYIISFTGGWLHAAMVCGDFYAMYREHHRELGTTFGDYFENLGTVRPINFDLLDWATGFFPVDGPRTDRFFRSLVRVGVSANDFRKLDCWGKLKYSIHDVLCDAARYSNKKLLAHLYKRSGRAALRPEDAERLLRSAIESGDPSTCRVANALFFRNHRIGSLCSNSLELAAAVGSVPVFRWLLENGGAASGFSGYKIIDSAISRGRVAFLRWFIEQYGHSVDGGTGASMLINEAIDAGETFDPDLATLKYCYALWDRRSSQEIAWTLIHARDRKNWRAFRWIYEQGHVRISPAALYSDLDTEEEREQLTRVLDEMGVDRTSAVEQEDEESEDEEEEDDWLHARMLTIRSYYEQ